MSWSCSRLTICQLNKLFSNSEAAMPQPQKVELQCESAPPLLHLGAVLYLHLDPSSVSWNAMWKCPPPPWCTDLLTPQNRRWSAVWQNIFAIQLTHCPMDNVHCHLQPIWGNEKVNPPVFWSAVPDGRVENCHDSRDRRLCKICAISCVKFSRKQCIFLQNVRISTRLTPTNCDFTLKLFKS